MVDLIIQDDGKVSISRDINKDEAVLYTNTFLKGATREVMALKDIKRTDSLVAGNSKSGETVVCSGVGTDDYLIIKRVSNKQEEKLLQPKNYTGSTLNKEVAEKRFEIKASVTGSQIENIIITAIEGGINYWAFIICDTEPFKALKGSDLSLSEKIVEIILNGGEVAITDIEYTGSERSKLTLESLLKGISLNAHHRPFDCDLENIDSQTADSIFQFALFGDLVFS